MSLSKRVSLPPQPPPSSQQQDLKTRVITCLNKLSDRDTLSVATTELESIARSLTDETFAPFLSYISSTSSSDKSSVRRQCIKILSFISVSHGDALSPHVSKMLAAVIKRLRDHDTSVRTACVHAVTSISSEITSHPFSSLSKPLIEAVMSEQDHNAQMGSALCLSAAIDASRDPEHVELKKMLPKFLKLVKSDGFKAKSALLNVVGSIVGSGSGSGLGKNCLSLVVVCLVEFLSSEDWAVRKAAVEALGRLAESEKRTLIDFKDSCVSSLENKRFDKVKVVRESMNQTLQLWKEIPGHEDQVPISPQLTGNSSSTVHKTVLETPSKETYPSRKHSSIRRSSPTATPSRSPPKSNYRKQNGSMSRKTDFEKELDLKVKVSVPKPESAEKTMSEKTVVPDTVDTVKSIILETEKRVISNRTRFGSRVVPLIDDSEMDIDIDGHEVAYSYGNQKEVEDMSRIQKQLVQIEKQQSNLLNMLQKFIGSSRSGMNSLETRVNGLEKTLDEISYDLAVSNGRVSSADSCCMSTEFLSPKYWWKAEGSYHSPKSPFRGSHQSPSDRFLPNKDFNPDFTKLGSPRGGISPNTPECGFGSPGRSLESLMNVRKKKVAQGHNRHFDRSDGGS
uniref:TORTIFOLIA1-like protein 4 n=1 Tax=Erigeron canadensis TaxID=72917 RepID=UPI001CB94628|nr:TORTIFOLIA1-like protein 4 [Erigeron canadensis]